MNRHGYALALLSAALFGASTPLAKMLLGQIGPWMLAAMLYLGAGAGLALLHAARRLGGRAAVEAQLTRADLPWLAAVIGFGGIAGPLLLMAGLARSDAAVVSLLLNAEGLATLAIAWLVFRENVDRRLFLGAMAILAGAVLLSWQGRGAAIDSGALLVLAACLCWGTDNNLTRRLSAADPVQIAMAKGLVAGSVNLAIALAAGQALPAPLLLLACGVVGFLGYGLSLVLFVTALRHLGAARTGACFALAPFVGAVLAVGLLGEAATPLLLVAGGLMAVGLWLHLTERHDHEHSHAALEHDHAHVHDAHHQHDHRPGDPPGTPHAHWHRHAPMTHRHPHYPDLHHRHGH